MQNINTAKPDQSNVGDQLVDAKTLREMTLTPAELFQIAKENTCTSFMTNMVDRATKLGQKFYQAQVLANADETLVNEIAKTFTDLGYVVHLSEVVRGEVSGQDTKVMTISWEDERVSDGPKN